MTHTPINGIAQGIDKALKHGGKLVQLFLQNPDDFGAGFAGATFDHLSPNHQDSWEAADLLAVTLLDVGVRPQGIREMLERRTDFFNELLVAVDADVPLWSEDDAIHNALTNAERLNTELRRLSGIGPVTASKLLARKRPRLVPIKDRVISARLGLQKADEFWRPLRAALMRDGVVDDIRAIRPPDHSDVSELRVLDIALWMLGSNSRAARDARLKAGVPVGA